MPKKATRQQLATAVNMMVRCWDRSKDQADLAFLIGEHVEYWREMVRYEHVNEHVNVTARPKATRGMAPADAFERGRQIVGHTKRFKAKPEFGVWTLPATQGAVRLATESLFRPAHYDAVERTVRRIGGTEITRQDVANVKLAIDTHESAICGQCGRFHTPPACEVR